MRFAKPYKRLQASGEPTMRHSAETIEAMRKHLLGYRDNMRVVVEHDIPVNAKTVADLRALATWPGELSRLQARLTGSSRSTPAH
jgi:hypothetical protein